MVSKDTVESLAIFGIFITNLVVAAVILSGLLAKMNGWCLP